MQAALQGGGQGAADHRRAVSEGGGTQSAPRADIGNVNAVSDAGVAVLLADAAAQSAALNVKINMGWITDEAFNEVGLVSGSRRSWLRPAACARGSWR